MADKNKPSISLHLHEDGDVVINWSGSIDTVSALMVAAMSNKEVLTSMLFAVGQYFSNQGNEETAITIAHKILSINK